MQHNTIFDLGSDPAEIEASYKANYPWLAPWTIRIASQYMPILTQLLDDFVTILGKSPKFRFLRITEDLITDEPHQGGLCIFISSPIRNSAKLLAMHQQTKYAIEESKKICKHCGTRLQRKENFNCDEDALAKYPSLKLLSLPKYARIRWICENCLIGDWLAEQIQRQAIGNDRKQDDVDAQSSGEMAGDSTLVTTSDGHSQATPTHTSEQPLTVKVNIIDPAALDRLETENSTGSRDTVGRIKGILKKIKSRPLEKELTQIPINWRMDCQQLAEDYPNFAEVILFLRNQMALSAVAGDRVLRFAPFLLVGGPGIGKSDFMLTLADGFDSPLEIINISNSQTGSALTGSEQYWGNSQTGNLFNTLVTGDRANPIYCLDEIDKARNDDAYNVLAALHQLLEAKQARRFVDLSVPDLRFDASHVLWMATANDLDQIAKPIVDRFAVFEIDEPNAEQMRMITRKQYRRFIATHPAGHYFEPEPKEDVLMALCRYHPRQVRKTLERCFGSAAFDERPYITLNDVHDCEQGHQKRSASMQRGIGFLAAL